MKLLVVLPAVGLNYGGPSKSVLELAQALGKHGIQVDVVTTNANADSCLNVPLQTWMTEIGKAYRIQYFPYWQLSDYKISRTLANWLFQHVTDYDLVHTNAIFSLPTSLAHWACQWHQIPYIMTPRGMLEPWALAYKAWKKQSYYTLIEKPALQQARAIQVLTVPEADSVRALVATPTIVIPNGIHRQEFENLPEPEYFYQKFPDLRNRSLILFMGRIDPKKGLDLLASAFARVQKQFPHSHLVIAGPDNTGFFEKTHSYFAANGCIDQVTFTGMLSGTLKYAALAAATLYVAPSYSEGFSMSVLEGLAAGLPCVITTGCNFPEAAIAQIAHVVDIQANAIADALLHCLEEPEKAKMMGDRARQFIFENYTWNQIAINLMNIYQSILEQKTAS